jgi:alpha-D-xyloside xylohydrolase
MHGTPPFRALVIDYPQDANTWTIDDQYMMGDRVMVAPVVAGQTQRSIYLPPGNWYDFWTGAEFNGGTRIVYDVPLTIIPIFVKADSLLPLATPTLHTDDPASYELDVRIFGYGNMPITLFEDDATTFAYEHGAYNRVTLTWHGEREEGHLLREGNGNFAQYTVRNWLT